MFLFVGRNVKLNIGNEILDKLVYHHNHANFDSNVVVMDIRCWDQYHTDMITMITTPLHHTHLPLPSRQTLCDGREGKVLFYFPPSI